MLQAWMKEKGHVSGVHRQGGWARAGVRAENTNTCHPSVSPQRRPWLGAPLQVGLVGFW